MQGSAPTPRWRFPTGQDMPATASFTIATWNIHKGIGTDRRRDLGRTAAVIAEIAPDIITLQEADLRFGTRAGLLDLDRLRIETGLAPVRLDRPGPSHGWHGNLILARDARVLDLLPVRLPGLEPRGAVIAELEMAGLTLRVIAAHLGLLPRSRRQQAEAIRDALDSRAAMPTLLMGDLNEWRFGPRSPLAALEHHVTPAPSVRSFPARLPLLPLDRIMTGPEGRIDALAPHDSPLARRASDHLPVKARLTLPAPQRSRNDPRNHPDPAPPDRGNSP